MKITKVVAKAFAIPLKVHAKIATRAISKREYVLIEIEDSKGNIGYGYIYAGTQGANIVKVAIEELFIPYLLGKDPRFISQHWDEMYQESLLLGRQGAIMRALSCVDIALWDLYGKICNEPLYRLLGGKSSTVPAYASGGYYREGKGLEGLKKEIEFYKDKGFTHFKIKVGGVSIEEDTERVRVARETIGSEGKLGVDANNAYKSPYEALRAVKSFEPYDLWFMEEPLTPDNIAGHTLLASKTSVPIATGEIEASRSGFLELLQGGTVSILQADAGVMGGITEWMRVAHTAASFNISIAPHWHANIHAHLVGAVSNGLIVEYFFLEEDIYNFEAILENPMEVNNGYITLSEKPGLGIEINHEKLETYLIEK